MEGKKFLMIPGPTPVPERVLLALARHPMGHRTKEFSHIFREVTDRLAWLHQTQGDVLTLATSGTGAMEAALINLLSPGDRVLCLVNGKFSERWAKICLAYGMHVETISAPAGSAIDPKEVAEALRADTERTYRAVVVTHSETSTGVLNDLETIAGLAQEHGRALTIVDAVTSLGAVSVPMDQWGLDAIASGSQKAYMIPPGLGFVAMSARAWTAQKESRTPKFYLDLAKYRKSLQDDTTPFTPAIGLVLAVHESLKMLHDEGLDALFARHERLRQGVRAGVRALKLTPFVQDEKAASPSITAVATPNADKIRSHINKHYDIALAGGQDDLSGKIFRIGHLGFVSERDILSALAALEGTMRALGQDDFSHGAGVGAALQAMADH
ncbi:pyridoxal-phosphate-dependent aminotransferase family protein [Anthocerotibacter panamensis]|uniref:pyridoxal-phosphate-dependent aminotransferase family protein n=1 Tax=Anthocerotibacter panamensis TaxID=2857077 RepID=UPI001C40263D|nr:alanine--glyoxylate aminotransferase family protein [Anthocerotibacter panamensis]